MELNDMGETKMPSLHPDKKVMNKANLIFNFGAHLNTFTPIRQI